MEVYSYDVCSTYLSYLEMCCDITLKCHGATFADFGIQNVKSVMCAHPLQVLAVTVRGKQTEITSTHMVGVNC